MKVYKFGGASVKDAEGINNLVSIVQRVENESLIVVVSAMGKTTNKLENIHAAYFNGETSKAVSLLDELKAYHLDIASQLNCPTASLEEVFLHISNLIHSMPADDFDLTYDAIVSNGEILSTLVVSACLERSGIDNLWLDMRQICVTDNNHREANVFYEQTRAKLSEIVKASSCRCFVVQGFIGGTTDGEPTTLGREGSDYTAAVVANLLKAESVTIWKDVAGIMNADPKLFPDVVHIPELTYYDAVELAYSGAQIIHPKTIRPLENASIPLYVKPFATPDARGSIIKACTEKPISVPVYILRKNQVLITVRPKDFSFVLEPELAELFRTVEHHKLKVSLIQSSAVTISVCVDASRHLQDAIEELRRKYNLTYNEHLALLTIRGTTPQIVASAKVGKDILLEQTTRRTLKIVYRTKE